MIFKVTTFKSLNPDMPKCVHYVDAESSKDALDIAENLALSGRRAARRVIVPIGSPLPKSTRIWRASDIDARRWRAVRKEHEIGEFSHEEHFVKESDFTKEI